MALIIFQSGMDPPGRRLNDRFMMDHGRCRDNPGPGYRPTIVANGPHVLNFALVTRYEIAAEPIRVTNRKVDHVRARRIPPTPWPSPTSPANHVRIVTAASLFDGHDAAINIMRRILQASGAEVIHLGHNRSVKEIVDCAIQEDAQGIAITSYQGGHVEYLKYMHDLLQEAGRRTSRSSPAAAGPSCPTEIEELHAYGIARIFSPDDGREMGLQGMINDVLRQCDFAGGRRRRRRRAWRRTWTAWPTRDPRALGRLISLAENHPEQGDELMAAVGRAGDAPGQGHSGAGHHRHRRRGQVVAGGRTGAALPGRLRGQDHRHRLGRSLAAAQRRRPAGRPHPHERHRPPAGLHALAGHAPVATWPCRKYVQQSIDICKAAGFDLVIVETSGIGQSDTEITEHSDVSLYVMTAEYGAATQLEKIDMLDFADLIAINKFDHRGSAGRPARRAQAVPAQPQRCSTTADDLLPVYGTIASQFNDPGMNDAVQGDHGQDRRARPAPTCSPSAR